MLELHRLLQEYRERGQHDAQQIPVFDDAAFRLGKYADGALLRFRGIIRDVLDPELVLLGDAGELANDEAYVATLAEDMNDKFVERVPLKVALVPYVNDWAAQRYQASKPSVTVVAVSEADASKAKGTKRSNDELEDSTMEENEASIDAEAMKKVKAVVADESIDADSSPAFAEQVVSIYAYDGQYNGFSLDAFKVNESFDFIGVLDMMVVGPANGAVQYDEAFTSESIATLTISDCLEGIQRKQQSSVVLHCCDVVPLEALHFVQPHKSRASPTLAHTNSSRRELLTAEWKTLGEKTDAASLRQLLIGHLAEALGGDELSADTTALGNLSVNLAFGKTVAAASLNAAISRTEATLKALVPMLAAVDMSIKSLNETKFLPYKDYENDVLRSGVLQFAHGTTVLVNETKLSAGNLNDQGVKNIGALQSLVEKMLLPYDFQYYSMDFPQNVAVLSLSQGKSILPVHVSVPVRSGDSTSSTPTSESMIECFRLYLAVLRSLEIRLGNEQAELAEQHYVACRKAKQEVSIDDLHRWLRLARLVAISRGEDDVSASAWDHMLALENARISRVDELFDGN